MSEGRTMLLVGAGGFVGSHLAAAAAGAGLRVLAAGREAAAGAPPCDLLDAAAVADCVALTVPDLVVNAAGAASVGRSWERPAETFAANATGTLNLLEAVARHAPDAHVLCLSSADVYGIRDAAELPLGEELVPRPVTPYGASKLAMEALCGQYERGRGLRVGVARAFNLIGPGQSDEFAISGFARRIAAAEEEGTSTELRLGNADATRDFTDVRDAAAALLELSLRELSGTFNLCSGQATTIAAVAADLAAAARVPVAVRADPELARPVDPPALLGDPGRLRETTGWSPLTPPRQSLEDLLEWWRTRLASA